ncbi:hypothetical protein JIN85_01825 [Luteolibacter pohnpeiensis]|uniref:PA14 domain-containing protein n=2 Tax=Luteolibacter pohnpeiensis TaxID=454153 RepID=A0A934S5H8_9BACT|nr:hypothetical protein [Luteolibacter pohnpeiensis]
MSYWRRAGGGSLTISIIVHVILLAIGLFWVLSVSKPPEKKIDFLPPAGGGGSPSTTAQQQKQQQRLAQNAPRIAALDAVGAMTLPEPDMTSMMNSLGALSSGGGMSAGMGGAGSGGGLGNGHGKGVGDGMGIGLGGGGSINPFGMTDPNANALVGTFYDLKQTPEREPTNITDDETKEVVRKFVDNWNLRYLSKYYKASNTLYQTKIYIPAMDAGEAPKAFNCANEVQPSRWVVVYSGNVIAPKTGKFRFVGAGDDIMVVRFNKKNVFDWGYTMGTVDFEPHLHIPYLTGQNDNREFDRLLRSSAMKEDKIKTYQYETTQNWNEKNLGLGVGPTFDVVAGRTYPVEILISEVPGGLFCAALHIEEVGADYNKASTGSPILPLFRFDRSLPEKSNADNAPPFDPNGPVWKMAKSGDTKFGI